MSEKDPAIGALRFDVSLWPYQVRDLPNVFHRTVRTAWVEEICKPQVRRYLRSAGDREKAWARAYVTLQRLAQENDVDLFEHNALRVNNDFVKNELLQLRLKVLRWWSATNVFRTTRINRITRRYEFNDDGTFRIVVRVEPHIGADFKDRSNFFRNEIGMQRWPADGPDSWRLRFVGEPIEVFYRQQGSLRQEFGYQILCSTTPIIEGSGSQLPTKGDLAIWLEEKIWLPLVRSYRVPETYGRLF